MQKNLFDGALTDPDSRARVVIQRLLKGMGYHRVLPDGDWGVVSTGALLEFQSLWGIKEEGLGEKTLEALSRQSGVNLLHPSFQDITILEASVSEWATSGQSGLLGLFYFTLLDFSDLI